MIEEITDQYCKKCGNELEWHDCDYCGGSGFSHHDCGEDSCCCLYPEDNVVCDICQGEGGWLQCPICVSAEGE
ncbi:MAG: hypothetical protein WBB37_07465 [bacterium]